MLGTKKINVLSSVGIPANRVNKIGDSQVNISAASPNIVKMEKMQISPSKMWGTRVALVSATLQDTIGQRCSTVGAMLKSTATLV